MSRPPEEAPAAKTAGLEHVATTAQKHFARRIERAATRRLGGWPKTDGAKTDAAPEPSAT
jgi:hypothetical protein